MGFFSRTLIGAGVGGAYGAMSDNGSALGGAIGGAAAGGLGIWGAKKGLGRLGLNSVSSGLRSGLGKLGGLSTRMQNTGYGMLGSASAIKSNAGVGMAWLGQRGAGGASALSSMIGRYSVRVNKWGGIALMGLGIGSGAMIGSSIIGSNQGY